MPTDNKSTNQPSPKGKGKPTPARKQQELLRKRPVVGAKSPEAKKLAKAALKAERARAREGLANGDDRYLTARDRGPQRRMVRDIVDSRFTVGELVLPSLFLVILVSSIQTGNTLTDYYIQLGSLILMWSLFIAIAIDGFLLGKKAQRLVEQKFGAKADRGIRWYAAMRSIQMRSMRLPKPQVKRGSKTS